MASRCPQPENRLLDSYEQFVDRPAWPGRGRVARRFRQPAAVLAVLGLFDQIFMARSRQIVVAGGIDIVRDLPFLLPFDPQQDGK